MSILPAVVCELWKITVKFSDFQRLHYTKCFESAREMLEINQNSILYRFQLKNGLEFANQRCKWWFQMQKQTINIKIPWRSQNILACVRKCHNVRYVFICSVRKSGEHNWSSRQISIPASIWYCELWTCYPPYPIVSTNMISKQTANTSTLKCNLHLKNMSLPADK